MKWRTKEGVVLGGKNRIGWGGGRGIGVETLKNHNRGRKDIGDHKKAREAKKTGGFGGAK